MSTRDRRQTLTTLSFMVAVAATGLVAVPALAQDEAPGQMVGDHRPAEEILAAYNAVEVPAYDASRRGEEGYDAQFIAARTDAWREQAELIGELHASHPADDRLPELLPVRWKLLMVSGEAERVVEETKVVANRTNDKALKADAWYAHASAVARATGYDPESVAAAAKQLYAVDPVDARNAELLFMTTHNQADEKLLEQTLRTIAAEYGDTAEGGKARAKIHQYDQVGKPFELSFEEATSGEPIDMSQLRGKVVVVDFWATWCGPCIAEMPHMKRLYAAYRDHGVEFIGVSLDVKPEDGGLDKLRAYVKDNGITWPQYYQGNRWESEFSSGWRVRTIPTLFLIDQEGRLVTPNARHKLDRLIPEVLGIDPIEIVEDGSAEG